MVKFYPIGKLNPLTAQEATDLQQSTGGMLPFDYLNFLIQYGYGHIHGYFIVLPFGKSTVGSAIGKGQAEHEWNLSPKEGEIIESSPMILHTVYGDTVALGRDKQKPFVILPRDSNRLTYHSNLDSIIKYYQEGYELPEEMYFDSNEDRAIKNITNPATGLIDEQLYKDVQTLLSRNDQIDKSYREQWVSTHIIQKIGGYIYFDDRIRLIQVKFQKAYKIEAEKLIAFLEKSIDRKQSLGRRM